MFKRFGKKTDTDPSAETDPKSEDKEKKKKKTKTDQTESETGPAPVDKPRKKRFRIRTLLVIVMLLTAIGIAGSVVWRIYFSGPGDEPPVYREQTLEHVTLDAAVMKFVFDHLYPAYELFIESNDLIAMIDKETARIRQIAGQYPEQKKIADKELKIWEKSKEKLAGDLKKIEKTIQDLYVLYAVNPNQGAEQITSQKDTLFMEFQEVLTPVRELTRPLKDRRQPPQGILQTIKHKISIILQ